MKSGEDAIRPRDGVKAPLLAAMATIALTLLVVLPALAQSNEGIVRYGGPPHPLIVAVFADVTDAQDGVPTNGVADVSQLTTNDDAYILSGADARNSFFGRSLYVSNQADAYNTMLITSTLSGIADGACARATVRNEFTGAAVELWLAATREALVDGARTYQGVVSAVPRHDDASQGPACTTAEATSPDGTVGESLKAGTAETALIPARDGDRLSIMVAGSTYTAGVTVDGEGPVFWVLSPRPDSILSSRTIPFSFEVTDDGSGLRHDGEDIVSANGRRITENVDDDHFTIEEPRSTPNGGASDIHVYLSSDPDSIRIAENDITPFGSHGWELVTEGAAYRFSAGVLARADGAFHIEFEATDRAGNTTIASHASAAVSVTPEPTPTPESTPTPEPTAAPTPEPTPTAEPVPDIERLVQIWTAIWNRLREQVLGMFF